MRHVHVLYCFKDRSGSVSTIRIVWEGTKIPENKKTTSGGKEQGENGLILENTEKTEVSKTTRYREQGQKQQQDRGGHMEYEQAMMGNFNKNWFLELHLNQWFLPSGIFQVHTCFLG